MLDDKNKKAPGFGNSVPVNASDPETTYIGDESVSEDYDLDEILSEFGVFQEKPDTAADETLQDKSRSMIAGAMSSISSAESYGSAQEFLEHAIIQAAEEEEKDIRTREETRLSHKFSSPEPSNPVRPEQEPSPAASDAEETYPEPEIVSQPKSQDAGESAEGFGSVSDEKKKRFISPIAALAALIAVRMSRNDRETVHFARDFDEELSDPDPKKSLRLYSSETRSVRKRAKISTFVSLVLLVLTFLSAVNVKLPGSLGTPAGFACVCLVLMTCTGIICLDVFTSGIMSIVHGRPGHEALAALAFLLALPDAFLKSLTDASALGMPYCSVAALALTCELWGACYFCRGCRSTFKSLSNVPEKNWIGVKKMQDGYALNFAGEEPKAFIRATEEADLSERTYRRIFWPAVIVSALIALASCVVGKDLKIFFHALSACLCISASLSSGLCFALPFYRSARSLYYAHSALTGWRGVSSIGKCRYVSVKDRDIFPEGSVELKSVRILEDARPDQVIAYTAAVLKRSGTGLSSAFSLLAAQSGIATRRMDEFSAHDGFGLTAMIDGSLIAVGGLGFMNLCGVRVPRKLMDPSAVYSSIDGRLVGIFETSYHVSPKTQKALADLIYSGFTPVFQCRDFNVSPSVIQKQFKLPADHMLFPPYSRRFDTEHESPNEIVAFAGKRTLESLAEIGKTGKRANRTARIAVAIAVAGTFVGLAMLLILFFSAAYTSAGAANIALFMLLWLLPLIILSYF